MTDREELIEKLKYHINFPHIQGHPDTLEAMKDAILALESQPFDVLEHLYTGGKAVDEYGTVIQVNDQECIERVDGLDYNIQPAFLYSLNWQPYQEPAAEGSRQWAMEQDCLVYHPEFIGVEGMEPKHIHTLLDEDRWKTGWSIFVEKREEGLYSILRIYSDIKVREAFWNGGSWLYHGRPIDEPYWCGDTLIILETPEGES